MAQYVEHEGTVSFNSTAPKLVLVFELESEPTFIFPPEQDFLRLLGWLESAHPAFYDLIVLAAERIVTEQDG
jgi:hypothetical protein